MDALQSPEPPRADEVPVCSAKGCRADARYAVLWNNPKVHAPEREKAWHACDDHRQSLADHLDVRGFLIRVEPLDGEGGVSGGGASGGGVSGGGGSR